MAATATLPPDKLGEPASLKVAAVNVGFAASISLRRLTGMGRRRVHANSISMP
jgi:hypothetical protein